MKKLFLIPLSIFAILMFACAGETEIVEVTKEAVSYTHLTLPTKVTG